MQQGLLNDNKNKNIEEILSYKKSAPKIENLASSTLNKRKEEKKNCTVRNILVKHLICIGFFKKNKAPIKMAQINGANT